jgi:predicted nuclease with RNAse H fold
MLNEKNVLMVLEALQSLGLSLEEYLVLLANTKGVSVYEAALDIHLSGNFSDIKTRLIDKGYLTDGGKRTMRALNIPGMKVKRNFDEFWEAYPTSDKCGGFMKTRVLRSNKPKARTLYNQALKTVSHEKLMLALEEDVKLRKKNSTYRNEMKFMPAITAWLNKRAYEAILEDLGDQEQTSVTKGPRYEGEID